MVQFNPFDDSFLKHKIGSTENISAPSKINETNIPSEKDNSNQNSSTVQKTDENDYLDTSDMIDDSADFSSSNFNKEDDAPQINATNNNTESSSKENNDKENKEEIMKEASQLMENFFDKKELNN